MAGTAGDAVLSSADLRRAVMTRQLLAARATTDVPAMLDAVAGLQSQYAPSMYIGCWSRLAGFDREQLTADLEQRRVVQGTMMRSTIHLVSAADYWPLNRAIRRSRRDWWLRTHRNVTGEAEVRAAAERVRAALEEAGRLSRKELDAVAGTGRADGVGAWVDLVRVPPSGTWGRRRADLYALAESWVGPEPDLSDEQAMDHLVRRYLSGFGPATANEIALWAGMAVGAITPVLARLPLRRFRTEDGKVLVDLPGSPLPADDGDHGVHDDASIVRFIGTWEALLLVHARRAEILREEDRPRIFGIRTPHSFHTFLVDGVVEGTWRHTGDGIELAPWRALLPATLDALHSEATRLATLFD
jgi:hypothetical protein